MLKDVCLRVRRRAVRLLNPERAEMSRSRAEVTPNRVCVTWDNDWISKKTDQAINQPIRFACTVPQS